MIGDTVVEGFIACRGIFSVISVSFLNPEAVKYFVTRKKEKEREMWKASAIYGFLLSSKLLGRELFISFCFSKNFTRKLE